MQYIKYDGRKLGVGNKLRLGGADFVVVPSEHGVVGDFIRIECKMDALNYYEFNFVPRIFPDLEILIEEPKISKEAAEALKARLLVGSYIYPSEWVNIIDSMTE